MRLQPWFAWSLAFGCVGWQLVARVGVFFSNLSHESLWSFPAAATGTVAINGLVGAVVLIMLGRGPRHLLVGLMVALGFVPFFVVGAAWPPGPGGLLAAAILLTVRAPGSWLLFGAVTLADASLGWAASDEGAVIFANRVTVTVIVGLTLFAVTRLAQLIQAADDTRRELAQAEATAERLRSAGRLHAVLGAQLSGLIQRARDTSVAATPARDDLAGITELARRATVEARQIATIHTDATPPPPTRQPTEPTVAAAYAFAWWVSLALVVSYASIALINVSWFGGADAATWAVVIATAMVSSILQLYHGTPRADGGNPRWWLWTLTAQASLLAVVTVTVGGLNVLVLWLLMAGTVVTRVHRSRSWLLVLGVLAFYMYYGYLIDDRWGHWIPAYLIGTLAIAIISVYALCSLPVTAERLHASRSDLARTAVATERLRFARDVHDLLGFHLSAIALKTELAARALDTDPGRTREQLAEVRRCAERALTEIRSIDGVADEITSRGELAAARSLLEAAEVQVSIDAPARPLPGVDHLVGIVVREAATNVVRHAQARRCVIVTTVDNDTVRLRITNDGVLPATGAAVRSTGTGIANLTARAEAVGGELTIVADGDTFTLAARLPTGPAATRSDADCTPAAMQTA
jgi:signal transduction histidine kinase